MKRRDFLKLTGPAAIGAVLCKAALGNVPGKILPDKTAVPQGSHVNNAETLSYKRTAFADPNILWEVIEPEDELGTLTDRLDDGIVHGLSPGNIVELDVSPGGPVGSPVFVNDDGACTTKETDCHVGYIIGMGFRKDRVLITVHGMTITGSSRVLLPDPVLIVPPGYEDKARQIIDSM